MKFDTFNFDQKVLRGILAAQYVECMPVQEQVFAHTLNGRDVLVQSQTGSGKTAAFLLTILQAYAVQGQKVKALVVVPTRELAVQIEDDARLLAEGLPEIRIGSFFGGIGYQKQEKQLAEGVDLIIGTPGRLIDFSRSQKIDFASFDIVVIDEADRLFDMGFYPDITHMMNLMRPREKRQTMLFSATLSTRVRNLSWNSMNEPHEIEIEPEHITVEEIRQELYHVSKNDKFELLLYLLRTHNLDSAIIFTNTKIRAVEVAKRLELNGYHVQFLMGDLPQRKRLNVIERMKSGDLKFLVATDVAARGLHVDDLQLVVNYDIPEDFENYVHRIGRTARAGKSGLAITMACEEFVYGLEAIQDFIGMKIPVTWLEDGALANLDDKSAGISLRSLLKGTDAEEFLTRGGDSRSGGVRKPGGEAPAGRRSSDSRRPASGRRGENAAESRRKRPAGSAVADGSSRRSATSEASGDLPKKRPVRSGSPTSAGQAAKSRASSGSTRNAVRSGHESGKKQKAIDYASIGALPLEERLAIYKQQLGGSGSMPADGRGEASGTGDQAPTTSAGKTGRKRRRKPGASSQGTRSNGGSGRNDSSGLPRPEGSSARQGNSTGQNSGGRAAAPSRKAPEQRAAQTGRGNLAAGGSETKKHSGPEKGKQVPGHIPQHSEPAAGSGKGLFGRILEKLSGRKPRQ